MNNIMQRSKMDKKILLIVMLAPFIMGVGISPSSQEIHWEEGLSKYVNIKIKNPEEQTLTISGSASGELEEYITFPKNDYVISQDAYFTYLIDLPETEKKGVLTTDIIIRADPESNPGQTQIRATTELVSVLKLIVPTGEKYVEGSLHIPKVETGKLEHVLIEMKNYGIKDIDSVECLVEFFDEEMIDSIRGERFRLASKEKKTVVLDWEPKMRNGKYEAVLTIDYDGNIASDERSFTVGGPEILLKEMAIRDFRLGDIARFDLSIESNWNRNIENIYIEARILEDRGIVSSARTESVMLDPYSSATIPAFIDTAGMEQKVYDLELIIHFLDRTEKQVRSIDVSEEQIGVTGKVVTEEPAEEDNLFEIMLLATLAFLMAVSSIVIWKNIKRK